MLREEELEALVASAAGLLQEQPRKLVIHWNVTLIVLSWIVSFLGTWTSSQVCCQASLSSRTTYSFYAWNAVAAVLFGLCSIWSLHFLAMLAAQFEVAVSLDPGLTAFSAILAVFFTWLALISNALTARLIRRRKRRSRKTTKRDRNQLAPASHALSDNGANTDTTESSGTISAMPMESPTDDQQEDTERQPLLSESAVIDEEVDEEREEQIIEAGDQSLTHMKRALNRNCQLRALAMDDTKLSFETRALSPQLGAQRAQRTDLSNLHSQNIGPTHSAPREPTLLAQATANLALQKQNGESPNLNPQRNNMNMQSGSVLGSASNTPRQSDTSSRRPSLSFFSRKWSSGTTHQGKLSTNGSSTDLTDGSEDFDHDRRYSESGETFTGTSTSGSATTSSNSFVRGLPLSRKERAKFKKGHKIAPMSVVELVQTLWGDCTTEAIAKSGIWAAAVVCMHYSGMSAFHLDGGFAVWNRWLVGASIAIAWIVCLIGILFMPNMEVHIGRQLAFSALAATGVFAMHFTGMSAATFYSSAPPTSDPGYPPALGFFIVATAISTCLISTTLVSYAATLSRNKLIEMIHIKQQLWRTLAQKEALDASVAMQTEFTSVAAHELRTPLFSVIGYADLLARTNLDEEQALYTETIRRACHTLQLISTNILDFSRMERANDETQARPVLVDLREFIHNLSEITEDKGPRISDEGEGLELVIDIADAVPKAVYLDETYLTRIFMNLLNNAVKFCSQGFIKVLIEKKGDDIHLLVADTGIGIPQRFLERIFEPFRQADMTFTRINNGSGLGLAICKRLVARLNGELSVTSTEGVGSTFLVDLKNVQCGTADDAATNALPNPHARTMMIFAKSPRTQATLEESWRKRGFIILPQNTTELRSIDFIWIDLPTLMNVRPDLLVLIREAPISRSDAFPYFLVVYSADTELLSLPTSPRIMPIKRPLEIHALAKVLSLPLADLPTMTGKEKPKLVRFASVQSSTTSEASEDASTAATSVESGGQAEDKAVLLGCTADVLEPTAVAHWVPEPAKRKILLVEDNLVNSKLGQRMLVTLGYEVILAYNGLEAFETVKSWHDTIHVVLMDLQMPVMSGEQSTQLIRQYEAENGLNRLVIIALSANVNTASSNKILDAGADGFVGKPVSMKGLDEALNRFAGGIEI